jgi:hypothetical protein
MDRTSSPTSSGYLKNTAVVAVAGLNPGALVWLDVELRELAPIPGKWGRWSEHFRIGFMKRC